MVPVVLWLVSGIYLNIPVKSSNYSGMKRVSNLDHLYRIISNVIVYLLKRNETISRFWCRRPIMTVLEADNQKRRCPMKVNDKFWAILPIFSVLGRLCIPDRYLPDTWQNGVRYRYIPTNTWKLQSTTRYIPVHTCSAKFCSGTEPWLYQWKEIAATANPNRLYHISVFRRRGTA